MRSQALRQSTLSLLCLSSLALGGPGCQSSDSGKSSNAPADESTATLDSQTTGSDPNATSEGDKDPSVDAKSGASGWPKDIPDGPRDLGFPCKEDKDCRSKTCAEVPKRIDGLPTTEFRCSECSTDNVCASENPGSYCMFDRKLRAKVCADGSPGDSCETDDQCQSKLCATVNLGDNETKLKACSTCRTHEDCEDESKPNCISRPEDSWKPFNQCLEDGVRKNGEVCFPCETGNRECEGLCVAVETPGSFCIGVCGACAIDSDCDTGYVCEPPKLTPGKGGMHQASKCVKKG